MKLQDWKAASLKKREKRMQAQASQQTSSPNFHRYSANLKAALADRNYAYDFGALKLLADTDRLSPAYNPYGKSIGRWCVFGADGWILEQSNSLR